MSTEQDSQEIADRINKMNKKCEVFSNPIRSLIASIIMAKEETTWTDLKATIEKITKSAMNPNTLGFHIGKLLEMEYIIKGGTREQPLYRIVKSNFSEVSNYIDPIIVAILKKQEYA